MDECICSNCLNLEAVIGEQGDVEEYQCRFGFPSEHCENCEGGPCNETCGHYMADEEEAYVTVVCAGCGKELKKSVKEDAGGDVYCVDCFFRQNEKE